MRQETSALEGAWHLSKASMKNSRGMSEEQIIKILEMKEKGAQYLNFQVKLLKIIQNLNIKSQI